MKKKIIFVAGLMILVGLIILILQIPGQVLKSQNSRKLWRSKNQLEYANLLLAKGLNKEAASAFEDYLDKSEKNKQKMAKICYTVGKIEMNLGEYEKALAFFYKAEFLDKRANFREEMNQKIVAALENLGMTSQAQYELQARTNIGEPTKKEGRIVARIGKEDITETQVNEALDKLPEWMKKQFQSKKGKKDFIRQYVANEALYRKAKRLGIDRNPETAKTLEDLRKKVVVQKFLQKEIKDQVKIEPQDVKLYYQANKDKYIDRKTKKKKSFAEVKNQVEYEYRQKKEKEFTDSLLKKTLEEQKVEFF